MSDRKALMAQLMDMPEFGQIFDVLQQKFYQEWLDSESPDERERLHSKVEILRELEGEFKSLVE